MKTVVALGQEDSGVKGEKDFVVVENLRGRNNKQLVDEKRVAGKEKQGRVVTLSLICGKKEREQCISKEIERATTCCDFANKGKRQLRMGQSHKQR